ncbi:XRE family transcriptional regulator [Burkholderia sp. Bp9143]|nr:XRE family transcriptional regulator [Burkholderia sp. Bp9143]
MEFSRRLRQLRVARGLTQRELASAAGVSVELIRRIEAGTSFPKLNVTRQLAIVLQVSAGTIVFGNKELEVGGVLRDQFEVLATMPEHVRELARELLDALIVRNRLQEKRSAAQ